MSSSAQLGQKVLEDFLKTCVRSEPNCDAAQLDRLLNEKIDRLVTEKNEQELTFLVVVMLHAIETPEKGDLVIAPLTNYLLTGEREGLAAVADMLGGPPDEASVPPEFDFGITQSAILCADESARPSVADILSYKQELDTASDFLAEILLQQVMYCAGWPEPTEPLAPIATGLAPTSLVVGGTNDTATPIKLSENMANAIGGYFLASSHEGHTAVYEDKSECVDNIATTFLEEGQLPTAGNCL